MSTHAYLLQMSEHVPWPRIKCHIFRSYGEKKNKEFESSILRVDRRVGENQTPTVFIRPYRKVPKFSDARKLCCNLPKIQTKRPNLRAFHQKHANGKANSEDPDQTAPLGAVRSGSALFAHT